jgi:plasmid stabilization system protein ParE
MRVRFSQTAKDQLNEVKYYIAKDNPETAAKHIKKVINRKKKSWNIPI